MENKGVLIKAILIGWLLVISNCSYAWCGEFGPFQGRIIDAETKEPIEGVVVLIEWRELHFFAGSTFYDAQETLTDKDGEFYIPGIRVLNPLVRLGIEANVIMYKIGYEAIKFTPWKALLEVEAWKQSIGKRGNYVSRVEDEKPVIMLRKVINVDERWKNVSDADPGYDTPDEKMKLLRNEINKEKEILRKIKP